MHSTNPEVETYGFFAAMPEYILTGLILGFISVLDDGIELAIGIHAANNICSCLFVTFDASALQTPAIFYVQNVTIGIEDTIELLLFGLLIIIFFARKYKWNFSVINKKVRSGEVNNPNQSMNDNSSNNKASSSRIFYLICFGIIIFSMFVILHYRNRPEKNCTVNLQENSYTNDLVYIPVTINDSVYQFSFDTKKGYSIDNVSAQKSGKSAEGLVFFENITATSGKTQLSIENLKITKNSATNNNEEVFLDDVEYIKQSIEAIMEIVGSSTVKITLDSLHIENGNGANKIKMSYIQISPIPSQQ